MTMSKMYTLLLTVFLLFLGSNVAQAQGVSNEEMKVYTSIFNNMFIEHEIIESDGLGVIAIYKKTYAISYNDTLWKRIAHSLAKWKEMNYETYRGFMKVKSDSLLLNKYALKDNIDHIYYLDSIDGYINSDSLGNLHKLYQHQPLGILAFTRAGFNRGKSQALLYLQYWTRETIVGYLILAQKKRWGWEVAKIDTFKQSE